MKKKKGKQAAPPQMSWQEITQTASRKVITAYARKRLLWFVLRVCLVLGVTGGIGAGIFAGFHYWHDGLERMSRVLPANPLRDIVLGTDGVLTREWVWEILEMPEEVDMLAVDIRDVKRRIESHGQVRSATVRRLPERLLIDIRERYPVARLAVQDDSGRVTVKLVDREGHVYRGINYERYELSALPFLDGVDLIRSGDGYRPLRGMDRVEELLDVVREHAPHIYTTWRVVDCGDFPNLTVRTEKEREVVFGPESYIDQLRWLDLILTSNQSQLASRQDRVDLSLGRNGVVVR